MSDLRSLYPCGRIDRRRFFFQSAAGFLGSALSSLWADDGRLMQDARLPGTPKAKSVIFLFMCGGVSHIDTFDPKDNKYAGKIMDAIGFGDNNAPMKRPVIPILRTYKQYGESGIPVSDWFPNVGSVIDEIAVVRSMYCHQTNHFPAVLEGATGKPLRQFEHPCLGSWVSYALGTANKNLPTFVNIGRPSSPVQLTGGYIGATVAATPFQPGETPVPNLNAPRGSSTAERERLREALHDLNEGFREQYATNSDIVARAKAYELAGRMQLAAPRLVDFSDETQPTLDLYGIGEKDTNDFGRQLLLARRLTE